MVHIKHGLLCHTSHSNGIKLPFVPLSELFNSSINMNSFSGLPIPFEIAELCTLIASHLTLHDFAQLCCVCKRFSQIFRPFVWSKVVLKSSTDGSRPPSVQALASNGQMIKHAELFSRGTELYFDMDDIDDESDSFMTEGDERGLALTLMIFCGSNLMSLKVVDHSADGRIWDVVMMRICPKEDVPLLNSIPLLNRIQVLHLSLAHSTLDSCFRRLLTQPEKYPGAAVAFAKVIELG